MVHVRVLMALALVTLSACAGDDPPADDHPSDGADVPADALADPDNQDLPRAEDPNVACDPGDRRPPDTDSPWVVVGTGEREYESLEPCQAIPIIQGLQGGFHVWGGFAAGGFDDPANLTIDFALDIDGVTVAVANYIDTPMRAGDVFEYAAVAVVLHEELWPTPEVVANREAILSVRISRDDGLDIRDAVAVVPYCCEL